MSLRYKVLEKSKKKCAMYTKTLLTKHKINTHNQPRFYSNRDLHDGMEKKNKLKLEFGNDVYVFSVIYPSLC